MVKPVIDNPTMRECCREGNGPDHPEPAKGLKRLWGLLPSETFLLKGVILRAGCFLERLTRLATPYRRILVVLVQAFLVVFSPLLAFLVYYEGSIPGDKIELLLSSIPILLVIRMLSFIPFGLFEGLWRYTTVWDLRNIAFSIALSSLAFAIVARNIPVTASFPFSLLCIDALILGFLLTAIRLTKRIFHALHRPVMRKKRILIFGGGDGGESVLREIERHPEHGYVPVGILDDDPTKQGTSIRGIRVLGTRNDLERVLRRHSPDEIIISIPSAGPEVLLEIARICRMTGLPVKKVPGLKDLLDARALLEMIQDFNPEELLCRPPVTAASPELERFYRGEVAMVTGAGGSIGSELVRHLARFHPSRLVLFERHEHSLYQIEMELRRNFPSLDCVPVIGDILDPVRVSQVLKEHGPRLLFHAAAYKHVPMMELNPQEAFKVNVLGTQNVARRAVEFGVERFVFISTDKAVNPVSVMGATKRMAEILIGEFSGEGRTKFMIVRFGNVLESSGSVVPLFKEQIKRGGPVTVTHPEATRFFMTTSEAVHLVLHAAILGKGGEIFVLDMGKPVKVLELARQLIRLYGLVPGRDVEIVLTGLRPGEKVHEDLFNECELMQATKHPKIRMASNGRHRIRWTDCMDFFSSEKSGGNGHDRTQLMEKIREVIEQANPLIS